MTGTVLDENLYYYKVECLHGFRLIKFKVKLNLYGWMFMVLDWYSWELSSWMCMGWTLHYNSLGYYITMYMSCDIQCLRFLTISIKLNESLFLSHCLCDEWRKAISIGL